MGITGMTVHVAGRTDHSSKRQRVDTDSATRLEYDRAWFEQPLEQLKLRLQELSVPSNRPGSRSSS